MNSLLITLLYCVFAVYAQTTVQQSGNTITAETTLPGIKVTNTFTALTRNETGIFSISRMEELGEGEDITRYEYKLTFVSIKEFYDGGSVGWSGTSSDDVVQTWQPTQWTPLQINTEEPVVTFEMSTMDGNNVSAIAFSGTVDRTLNLENPTDFSWAKLDFSGIYEETDDTKLAVEMQFEAKKFEYINGTLTPVASNLTARDILFSIFLFPVNSTTTTTGTSVRLLYSNFVNLTNATSGERYGTHMVFDSTDHALQFSPILIMEHTVTNVSATTGTTGLATTGIEVPATTGEATQAPTEEPTTNTTVPTATDATTTAVATTQQINAVVESEGSSVVASVLLVALLLSLQVL